MEKMIVVEDLEFLRFDSPMGYMRRHVLNFQLKRALKMAIRKGLRIVAVGEDVARGLHRYYYIPLERITVI